ncbi:MAG: NADH-quinone oxidoreductase subunit N [Deltaproteobacteria bacterium]|nr:NADH-quinone oxidoreductase subunit N [Deltaproteobacteria bacterium]
METSISTALDASQFFFTSPILVLALGGIIVLLLDAYASGAGRRWLMWVSAGTCVLTLLSAVLVFRDPATTAGRELFDGMLVADRFALFLTMAFVAAAFLTLLLSGDFLREHGVEYGEYYSLVLFATSGMVILAMAGDLVTVFLGIETMSLAVYVLTGSFRNSVRSSEAALKYFLTGAFASAILLYGMALVYGTTGTTNLKAISEAAKATEPVFLTGEFLLIAAFGFKLAAAPFHMWAPDAYEGAPTPVTAFMAAGVKAAGFAGILRLFLTAFGGDVLPFGNMGWGSILGILAAITMTVGNLAALRQENVKRLLAYSSISHAGYLLIGVVASGIGAEETARPAMLFYLLAYTFTTVGTFGVIAWLGSKGDERLLVDDWSGLATRHPAAALVMTIFLLSLAGMPPTAGFFGKFYVFRAAMQVYDGQLLWLVIVAVLNSIVSVYYYLKIVMAMYFREPTREPRPLQSPAVTIALALAALFVLEMGLLPGFWLDLATSSVMSGMAGL